MKMLKTVIAATVLSLAVMGSASALTLNQVSSSVGIRVTIENGVATLFGHVDSNFERIQAANAAKKLEGVERVRNLLTF